MSMPAGIKTCGIRVEAAPAPWLPAGDLTPGNVTDAIRQSGTPAVDVSSRIEDAPGVNNRR